MEDELNEHVPETLPGNEFRLACESSECANLDRTFRRDGIYRRRWQWWYPWGVTRWWLPRWFSGGDEWCNDSFSLVIPPFGCFTVFWRKGRLRTLPYDEEWRHMSDFQRADYAPCGYLHGGRLSHHCRHHHNLSGTLCPSSITWLAAMERRAGPEEGAGNVI